MKKMAGFTLTELMIVVLILGALAAIAIPKINANAAQAKQNACGTNVDLLNSQIELFAANSDGVYPATFAAITGNDDYFPEGAPECPLDGSYTMDEDTHRVSCSHGD